MNDIHVIACDPTSLNIKLWDVRFVENNNLVGIIKKTKDEHFIYTDTFGQKSEEFDSLTEARDSVTTELEGLKN